MKVRKVDLKDRQEWARMRNLLWNSSLNKHLQEIDEYFAGKSPNIVNVFVLETNSDRLGGFIELNIRNYAEGSESEYVPYVEGWYVESDLRQKGFGKQLMTMAEKWAIDCGFDELASDTELENSAGITAHQALGFQESERIVCFVKKLIDLSIHM